MARFRRIQDPIRVGDSIAELVLTNSHDRSSAYQFDIGLFRLVCSNCMVTSIGDAGGIRVRHGKNVANGIIKGSHEHIEEVPRIAASVHRFRATEMDPAERQLFAEVSLEARYGPEWGHKAPVVPAQLLNARRSTDTGHDLWATFNRVQENLLKGGGLPGRSKTGRPVRTRAIRSVGEDVRLNRALWRLAERFAELKAA